MAVAAASSVTSPIPGFQPDIGSGSCTESAVPERLIVAFAVLVALAAFSLRADVTERGSARRSFHGQVEAPRQGTTHLKVSGTRLVRPDSSTFHWRGISAFRLLEFVAHGRESEADAYLRWAAAKKLTVVRVFAMADGIFDLPPADGQRALPRLLEMAQRHGLYVEVVVFTGT